MITFVTFHVDYRRELGDRLENSQIYQKKVMLARFRRVAAKRVDYHSMLEILFQSIDRTHQLNRKVLLTDKTSAFQWPAHLRVDVVRREIDVSRLMLSRLRAQVDFLRDCDERSHYVFVDSDMIVNRDLALVFEKVFDIALTYRTIKDMPINGGVIFVHRGALPQAREIFAKMLDIYESRYLDHDVWWGDQLALRDILELGEEKMAREGIVPDLPYQVLLLDAKTYNYSAPGTTVLAHAPDKYILHFKSWHKDYMAPYWERWVLNRWSPGFLLYAVKLRGTFWKWQLHMMAEKLYRELACR